MAHLQMDVKGGIGGVGSIFTPLESADVQTPSVQVSAANERHAVSHFVIDWKMPV